MTAPSAAPAVPAARALAQRLRAAASVLLPDPPGPRADPSEDAGLVLLHVVAAARASGDVADLWLIWTALAAAHPTGDEVIAAQRTMQLTDDDGTVAWLLEATFETLLNAGAPQAEMDVVTDAVVVDVDFCATSDHHTGIQRVVRETVPRWVRDHDVELVAWTHSHGGMRRIDEVERNRVIRWDQAQKQRGSTRPERREDVRLVVPWRSTVVLPENPEPQRCPSIAAIAQFSGNAVTAIGYDCIPVVSPELIHPGLPDRFVHYLSVVKHARTVAGISTSATEEFRGFAQMMPSQGLPGPEVVEVALPVEVPPAAASAPSTSTSPLVMSVGSFEPRKNQLGILYAAERLWQEGLQFRLQFIGGGGWRTEFDAEMNRLAARGRDVGVAIRMSDEDLWATYGRARFSVFASLHEGYGLPVAESLAHGTPALTTSYGSTAEIAAEGGAITVDPRDDEALVAAMRRLLVDDELVAQLETEARNRPVRTWDHYAAELWTALAAPRPSTEMDTES